MHTLTYVILPPDTRDISATVTRLLDGSSAAPDVAYPDVPVRCYCWDGNSLSDSFDQVDADPRYDFPARIRVARTTDDEHPLLIERFKIAQALQQQHPEYGKTDPDCEACQGSGTRMQTRDPFHHWDWWVIGGRWNGWCDQVQTASPRDEPDLVGNIVRAGDLWGLPLPGALITPDGLWYEGPMLIGNVPAEEDLPDHTRQEHEAWIASVQHMLTTYADHTVVVVDTHF